MKTDLLEQLFEQSPDAILIADSQGLIVRVNAELERAFGYPRAELAGQSLEILIPERFRTAHPRYRESFAKQPRRRPMGAGVELYARRKDGSEFPVDIMLSPMETNEGSLVLAAIRDISDRKRVEDALRQSEQYSRTLFEFSPDAVMVCDANGTVTDANARVKELFGYTREELLGQSVDKLIPGRFRDAHPKHRAGFMAAPRVRPMGVGLDLQGLRKDGTEFPVDILLGPLETARGRMVVTIVRDLSERRRYEEALKRSEEERRYLEEELITTHQFEEIIGGTASLKRVLKQAETVAPTDATVLILGETGTGKELIARAIHNLSQRREQPFVKLNCSAIPAGLLESELFGHERGAFTGAVGQKIGRLELAHQGTLFLDEIGDLPLELQPKILRALQEKEFERLGSTRTIPVNVRLLAATNRDLAKMVERQEFRPDLYYRLKVFPVEIPPLRERRQDIPLLVKYFLDLHARRLNRRIETIPPHTMHALEKWRWPGNVRELENFIERAVILTTGSVLKAPLAELQAGVAEPPAETTTLQEAEREHVLRALKEAKGLIGGAHGAAERLGIKRTTLNSKLKKLGIKRSDYI